MTTYDQRTVQERQATQNAARANQGTRRKKAPVKTVYILTGAYSYEGDTVLAVFASEKGATDALERCEAHKRAEPKLPADFRASPLVDATVLDYRAAHEQWREGCPYESNYDWYAVAPAELRP